MIRGLRRIRDLVREGLGREITQSTLIAEQLREELKSLKVPRTRSFGSITGVQVSRSHTLMDLKKTSGVIRDLVLKTTSSAFSLHLRLDEEDIVENSFSEIVGLTEEMETIAAFQEGNIFTVHATNLGFRESAFVLVSARDLTFKPLYALVDIF